MKRLKIDELMRLAFVWAEQDRSSFADAWPDGSEEQKAARWEQNQLREYRLKRWGKTRLEAKIEQAESRTIPIP